MGHGERPLAEVFSVMPRCAPLRLPEGDASGGPFARPLPACIWNAKEGSFCAWQETFTLSLQTVSLCYVPVSMSGAGFALPVQISAINSLVRQYVRFPTHRPKGKFLDIIESLLIAPLAQLDRASGYEPEGREFESLRARHSFNSQSGAVIAGCSTQPYP